MAIQFKKSPCAKCFLVIAAVLFLIGLASMAIWLLDAYLGIHIIQIEDSIEYASAVATCSVVGIISLVSAAFLLVLLIERRTSKKGDRRQKQVDIDFPDRRVGDRRQRNKTEN